MRTPEELLMLQTLPLDIKIAKTKQRIREWVQYYGEDDVYVSFSGGKDSTVLLHIVREEYPDIQAVFLDTGLEYPEIKQFVKSYDNVTILRPDMNFREVIIKYGYPFISKEISECVSQGRLALHRDDGAYTYRLAKLQGTAIDPHTGKLSMFNQKKYEPLLYTDFIISNQCCNVMKKKPLHALNNKYPFIATMTAESRLRKKSWLQNGCNAFDAKHPVSTPMSFWTEQDVLQYIQDNQLKICSVYGDIVEIDNNGNLTIDQCGDKLCCTGCQRTGCVFCGFGAHLDTVHNGVCRYERLKQTHPKLFDYCMRGGEYNDQGIWQPTGNGLGMAHVINELNKLYNKTLKDGTVKKFIDVDISEYIKED